MTVRSVINGITAETPIIVASRTMASILSPLSTACASVSRTRGSDAGGTGSRSDRVTLSFAAVAMRARYCVPRPSKTSTRAPAPRRSTRTRCALSSEDSVVMACAGSRSGA